MQRSGSSKLALIAGRGTLPTLIAQEQSSPPLICALAGNPPDQLVPDKVFRLEELGRLLKWLKRQGVNELCLCGGVRRPPLQWWRLAPATLPMLPRILRALRRGDDGALRIVLDLLEEAGFTILAAHEVAPDLLLPACVLNGPLSDEAEALARLGDDVSETQAQEDLGQASVLRDGALLLRESDAGTDAMLSQLAGISASAKRRGILYKAPKPGQDRRADLPAIGPETILGAARAGLAGIVIEAGGVLALNQPDIEQLLSETGLFLWSRERPA